MLSVCDVNVMNADVCRISVASSGTDLIYR